MVTSPPAIGAGGGASGAKKGKTLFTVDGGVLEGTAGVWAIPPAMRYDLGGDGGAGGGGRECRHADLDTSRT